MNHRLALSVPCIVTMPCVVAINAGSSSIRLAVYDVDVTPRRRFEAKIDRIGLSGTTLHVSDLDGIPQLPRHIVAVDHRAASGVLLDVLEAQPLYASIVAVGHRVVHGMTRTKPERVTPPLLAALRRITPYAPDHLRREIGLIEAFSRRLPTLPQVACFDTAFHRTMPRVAKQLPLPRHYTTKGLERYGFHGLSYSYLMAELGRLDPAGAQGRVILAHLGNGASMAAVLHGKSVDTSMGFTPTAGLVMGTRTGDLDPGLVYYLARTERMTAAQFHRMVNHESGLLGVSGISSDLRDLCAREADNVRAEDAVALFCYQAKKWIGSFAAVLGGVDTLVFAGGIGENASLIRERICDGLDFLGITLNSQRNAKHASVISPDASHVTVRVIRTDEELMIARSIVRVLDLGATQKHKL